MTTRPREYPVPALEKGLDVLEALAVSSGPLTLAELAERLDRTRNELFRMLSCLEKRGYVQRDAAGANRLTLKLFELAHRHPPIDMLLRIADRPMQEIALAIEQSVHISVISRGRLVVLAQADSPRKVRIAVEVGGSFPVIETISGRLLLAHYQEPELTHFLDHDPEHGKLTKAERATLMRQLERLRADGHGTADNESMVGLRDIAVLVGNSQVGVMAALASPRMMSARRPASDDAQALQEMRRQAQRITEQLGLRGA